MLEVLQFIFSSFWVWFGTVILIASFSTWIPHFQYNRTYTSKKGDV